MFCTYPQVQDRGCMHVWPEFQSQRKTECLYPSPRTRKLALRGPFVLHVLSRSLLNA